MSTRGSIINPKGRLSQSFSRMSFLSNTSQDNIHLSKSIHQTNPENLIESIKNGIHVEFKLSVQIDETKQQQQLQIQASNEQKGFYFKLLMKIKIFVIIGVIFDVPKPLVDVYGDIIALTQSRCKRLLAETKQKMFVFKIFK